MKESSEQGENNNSRPWGPFLSIAAPLVVVGLFVKGPLTDFFNERTQDPHSPEPNPHDPVEEYLPVQQYKIRSGDTLSSIAEDAGLSLDKLMALNPQIQNPNVIMPGQTLYISEPRLSQSSLQLLSTKTEDAHNLHPVRQAILAKAFEYDSFRESGGENRDPDHLIRKFQRSHAYKPGDTSSGPIKSSYCAGFVSYVMDSTTTGGLPYETLSVKMKIRTRELGAYYGIDSDYAPKPGDFIFFDRGDGPKDSWMGHMGFVVGVEDDGSVRTIEANKSHPDHRGKRQYEWTEEKPDGVYYDLYRPHEFERMRVEGFGNMDEIIARTGMRLKHSDVTVAQNAL